MNQKKTLKNSPKKSKIELFRDQISNHFDLLSLAETPAGFLWHLSKIMEKIQSCQFSAKICQSFLSDLDREDKELQECKKRLIDWMLSKISILKTSAYYGRSSLLKKSIEEAEAFLMGKVYEIQFWGSYLRGLYKKFEDACSATAYFGERNIFDGYATISTRLECISFDEELFPDGCDGELTPASVQGAKLSETLQHGFIKANVRKNDFCPGKTFYDMNYGVVDSIQYPPKDDEALKKSEQSIQWKISEDCNPTTNFRYLCLLSRHPVLKSVPLSNLPRAKDALEAEEFNNQQQLQFFLSGFSADWDQAPESRDKILKLIKRLIAFIEEAIIADEFAIVRGPREMKDAARKFIRSVLEKNLIPLPYKERNEWTYDNMRPIIWREAEQSDVTGLQDACSNRLIHDQCKAFAKEHKWRPKRGKKGSAV